VVFDRAILSLSTQDLFHPVYFGIDVAPERPIGAALPSRMALRFHFRQQCLCEAGPDDLSGFPPGNLPFVLVGGRVSRERGALRNAVCGREMLSFTVIWCAIPQNGALSTIGTAMTAVPAAERPTLAQLRRAGRPVVRLIVLVSCELAGMSPGRS